MLAPLLLLLATPAQAIQCLTPLLAEQRHLFGPMPTRPTEGGMFSFEEEDVVEHLDSADGAVRVHYSVSGPNVTLLTDDDADGLPDYAELVAETTAGVFDFYEGLGFHALEGVREGLLVSEPLPMFLGIETIAATLTP